MAAPVLAALAVAILAAFAPALRAGFVFDDGSYLLDNPAVRGGLTVDGLSWALTSFHAANWHPVTWISHMLDVTLFGMRPAGHHLTNLLLHALNAGLLFLVLRGLTGAAGRSALAAALFALHPLRVESVAWVAERKDLLSGGCFLLALAAYRRHARRPGPRRYALVALPFALGLMAKPMLVTLPFVLLLLDWWPLQRAGRAGRRRDAAGLLALEKLPLLALSAASAAVTMAAQRANDAMVSWDALPPATRAANAAVAYALYLRNTFWPSALAAFYPHAQGGRAAALVVVAAALLAGLTIAALLQARCRPWLAAGWLWFAGMLVPAIGIVQVGGQALADRYTYLPQIGLCVAVVWGLEAWARRLGVPARVVLPAAAAAGLCLAAVTWRQAGFWLDQGTLFSRAVAVTSGNFVAHFNLGVAADAAGRADEAVAQYHEALRLQPRSFEANLKLGNALVGRGDAEAGAGAFRLALAVRPDSVEALVNLASALSRLRRHDEALAALRRAIDLQPDLAVAHMNLGNILSELGRGEEALAAYALALRHAPGMADARYNLGVALERLGRPGAAAAYDEALRLQPGHAGARLALERLGQRRR